MDIEALKQRLQETIGTGEILNIIYHGGSEPDAARQLFPMQIKGDQLRARCLATNRVKTYSLSKIEWTDNDTTTFHGTHDQLAMAIEAGDLIKIDYSAGKNSLHEAVVIPIVQRQLPCPVGDNYLDRFTDT